MYSCSMKYLKNGTLWCVLSVAALGDYGKSDGLESELA
jgi:hypothetical protein